MDVLKAVQEFLESFRATPTGIAILFVLFVIVVMLLLIWVKVVQSNDKRDERDTELEKLRLKNQQEDEQRKAANDARLANAVENTASGMIGIKALLDKMIVYEQRLEMKMQAATDILTDTKASIEAVAIRAERIHTDVRTSAVKLADKLDNANNESRTRWENTQIAINNRAQETQKTVHSVGDNIQTAMTGQNTVLDQVLNKLIEVDGKLAVLSADFQRNTTAQSVASEQKQASELSLLNNIQASLKDIMAKVETATRKRTEPLDPAKVIDPLARPTVTATFAEPSTDTVKHDTQPLVVTPPTESK